MLKSDHDWQIYKIPVIECQEIRSTLLATRRSRLATRNSRAEGERSFLMHWYSAAPSRRRAAPPQLKDPSLLPCVPSLSLALSLSCSTLVQLDYYDLPPPPADWVGFPVDFDDSASFHEFLHFGKFSLSLKKAKFGIFSFGEISFYEFSLRRNLVAPINELNITEIIQ